jgi:acetyl-CoA carboxylase biotin carboxyl carrier protein
MSNLSYEDIAQILAILREADFERLELQVGDLKLVASRRNASRGAHDTSEGPSPTTEGHAAVSLTGPAPRSDDLRASAEVGSGSDHRPGTHSTIDAPMVGIFYGSPRPGEAPFVEIGQAVEPSSTVGLIEVMKMFTAVAADTTARILERLVADGDFVEFGQPLFVVDRDPV